MHGRPHDEVFAQIAAAAVVAADTYRHIATAAAYSCLKINVQRLSYPITQLAHST